MRTAQDIGVRARAALSQVELVPVVGKVTQVVGLLVEGWVPGATVGAMCRIRPETGGEGVAAEVVGFRRESALLMPLGDMRGVAPGSSIFPGRSESSVAVGAALLGRVIDGMGRPLDRLPPPALTSQRPIHAAPPPPLRRSLIREPLSLGVRAIDACVTCGQGQRLAIVAGSGVGKSVLMGMLCRNSQAEVNVVALIGERGREVRQFIQDDLGAEGLRRSVVVVATADRSPVERIRAALVATAVAEHFRDAGQRVLLTMDSLTRVAMAQREIGLAIGEPPTTKGYPPSMLGVLPRLVERAGPGEGRGSITALYTVLAESDDLDDPVVDAARAALDGHIVLSRAIASRGHYPAIDVLRSISRLMNEIVSEEHRRLANEVRAILADYEEVKDLVHVGAYARGSNPKADRAIERIEAVQRFLAQGRMERFAMTETLEQLRRVLSQKEKTP